MHINRWMKSTANTSSVYIKSSWTHMTLYANLIYTYYTVTPFWVITAIISKHEGCDFLKQISLIINLILVLKRV